MVCTFLGVLIIAGVVGIAVAAGGSGKGGGGVGIFNPFHGGGIISDARLKHDIKYVKTLENGIRLHSFKYLGDDRTFVGPIAQELAADPRFKSAVGKRGDYLMVDLKALGLRYVGLEQMQQAGDVALAKHSRAL